MHLSVSKFRLHGFCAIFGLNGLKSVLVQPIKDVYLVAKYQGHSLLCGNGGKRLQLRSIEIVTTAIVRFCLGNRSMAGNSR